MLTFPSTQLKKVIAKILFGKTKWILQPRVNPSEEKLLQRYCLEILVKEDLEVDTEISDSNYLPNDGLLPRVFVDVPGATGNGRTGVAGVVRRTPVLWRWTFADVETFLDSGDRPVLRRR